MGVTIAPTISVVIPRRDVQRAEVKLWWSNPEFDDALSDDRRLRATVMIDGHDRRLRSTVTVDWTLSQTIAWQRRAECIWLEADN